DTKIIRCHSFANQSGELYFDFLSGAQINLNRIEDTGNYGISINGGFHVQIVANFFDRNSSGCLYLSNTGEVEVLGNQFATITGGSDIPIAGSCRYCNFGPNQFAGSAASSTFSAAPGSSLTGSQILSAANATDGGSTALWADSTTESLLAPLLITRGRMI